MIRSKLSSTNEKPAFGKRKMKCIKNNFKFHETLLFLFVSSYVLFIFQNSFFKVGGKVVQASLYATFTFRHFGGISNDNALFHRGNHF